jgi:hypothetical protein
LHSNKFVLPFLFVKGAKNFMKYCDEKKMETLSKTTKEAEAFLESLIKKNKK